MLGPALVVTTSRAEDAALVARARGVAERCRAPFRPRRGSLDRLLAEPGVDLVYVVSAAREEIRDGQERLAVHEGLLKLKRGSGSGHPLLRAVAPPGGPPVTRVVDANLGLAQDSLHMAAMLGVEVYGLEASPVVASLAEAGLSRIAGGSRWADAARQISVRVADAEAHLSGLPAGFAEVVYLDPMFELPMNGQPGYDLLRRCAQDAPLSASLLAAAARVAAHRVVVKVPFGRTLPELDPSPFERRVCGKAIDYLVVEKVLEGAGWERPRRARQYPYRPAR